MKITQTKVVYTAVFGNYDNVASVNPDWDCDFICFTENPNVTSEGWQIVVVQMNSDIPANENRRYKMLPHKYLPNYEHSLYIDGNIKIVADPSPLFQKYLDNSVIAIPKHPSRNCAYAEAKTCINLGLADEVIVEKQMSEYTAQGFPKNYGLTVNNIIFRHHRNKLVINLMESWWKEYDKGGKRDQLSLSYLSWRDNVNIQDVTETAWSENKYFRIKLHDKQRHKSLIGRFSDYIYCNRYDSFVHKFIYTIFRLIGKVPFFRDNLR